MLSYENVDAAVDWLSKAFGFRERGQRFVEADGTVTHAELELDGAVVMLGWPGPAYRSPRSHALECEGARRWLQPPNVVDGVLVYVDDVDSHYERARAAGASILTEPADEAPGRLYKAGDLEGHRWMFMQAPR
jgi:uncharacterized glyoxalase superfamily protein PhnB